MKLIDVVKELLVFLLVFLETSQKNELLGKLILSQHFQAKSLVFIMKIVQITIHTFFKSQLIDVVDEHVMKE